MFAIEGGDCHDSLESHDSAGSRNGGRRGAAAGYAPTYRSTSEEVGD